MWMLFDPSLSGSLDQMWRPSVEFPDGVSLLSLVLNSVTVAPVASIQQVFIILFGMPFPFGMPWMNATIELADGSSRP